ncbi:uncharacterized protein FFB20_09543 [Fusarium fujikuroi]|nr:uncharacterized protein FFB20_09543 [Fusarium fujikuroi]
MVIKSLPKGAHFERFNLNRPVVQARKNGRWGDYLVPKQSSTEIPQAWTQAAMLVAHLCWLRLDNKCPVDVGKRFETCRHYPRYRALRDAEVMCRRPLRAALTDNIQKDHQLQIQLIDRIGPS